MDQGCRAGFLEGVLVRLLHFLGLKSDLLSVVLWVGVWLRSSLCYYLYLQCGLVLGVLFGFVLFVGG